jgi:hypothetical protein
MWSWLSKLVSILLVLSLTVVIFTQIVGTTALNSNYVVGQVKKVDGYSRLSKAISHEITREVYAAYPNLPPSEQIGISPAAIELKLKPYLTQLTQYATGDAPAPTLDFSDLVNQSRAAGLPIPDNSPYAKPITLSKITSSNTRFHGFDDAKKWSTIASTILVLLLGFLCYQRRRYVAPSDVLMWTGITTSGIGLSLKAVSSVMEKWLHFNGGVAAVTDVVRDLAAAVIGDTAGRLFVVAAIIFAIGLVSRITISKILSSK